MPEEKHSESLDGSAGVGRATKSPKSRPKRGDRDALASKRRCVSTACIACRRRKSKCDGNTPSCAACASVYGTECIYDPNSDHRRKGVYKKDIDNLKTKNSTLQTLIQGILNYPERDVLRLVKQIRTCENLEDVADEILVREAALEEVSEPETERDLEGGASSIELKLERELAGRMGELRLENGAIRFLGGTSNLLHHDTERLVREKSMSATPDSVYQRQEDAIRSWTSVTADVQLIVHLLNMYFTWHYTYFTTLSKPMFFRDFFKGKRHSDSPETEYCTALLVNAMLALGCHFTSWPAARSDPEDSGTAGDHFFKEAKRLILENDAYEDPRLPTVQALALMSVREAGCGREAKGWVHSGMSFRMACDLGLNVDSVPSTLDEEEVDARRVTFWGCFLFDKCWSNYLGRPPQLPLSNITTPKFDVFPVEDSESWSPWTDAGLDDTYKQPSRTRAIALQISTLCEISNDLILSFYRPTQNERPVGKQAEMKKVSDFHTRLEGWRKALPKEMEAKEGQLPNILLMHMFFQLLYIHLFRPFLKYTHKNSPLPSHVSPRKICTQAATIISKVLRYYKRTYGFRQICNIAVYMAHSACTIHLLNLPDKDARRDIAHGVRHLEEIADSWLCARRTLITLGIQVRRWDIALPPESAAILARSEARYGGNEQRSPSPGKLSPTMIQMHPPASNANSTKGPVQTAGEVSGNVMAEPSPLQHGFLIDNAHSTVLPRTEVSSLPPDQPMSTQPLRSDEPWLSTTTARPTVPKRASIMGLVGGLDGLFEEGRDWWLKDQSLMFDHWGSRRESGSNAVTDSNGVGGLAGGPLLNGGALGGSDDAAGLNEDMGADGMGYMGFGADGYGYGDGRMY